MRQRVRSAPGKKKEELTGKRKLLGRFSSVRTETGFTLFTLDQHISGSTCWSWNNGVTKHYNRNPSLRDPCESACFLLVLHVFAATLIITMTKRNSTDESSEIFWKEERCRFLIDIFRRVVKLTR